MRLTPEARMKLYGDVCDRCAYGFRRGCHGTDCPRRGRLSKADLEYMRSEERKVMEKIKNDAARRAGGEESPHA